jgi:thymidylate synthase
VAPTAYDTFEHAYLANLAQVRAHPEFVNAPRGFRSREILGLAYRLSNPCERMIRIPERRINIVFNFAEVLWYLSGRDSLDFVAFYAPSMRKYSADGRTLRGTAYGPRIFNFGGAGFNQWDSVIRTLRADPDSKRAVIQIFAPEELLIEDNVDVACTIGLQYMIREGDLHAVSYMRANDAYRGTVSDVFSFTFLQELLATQLGLRMGSYTHVAGSYHLYEADQPLADRVLASRGNSLCGDPFPAMPPGDNWPAIAAVLELEEALRTQRLTLQRPDIDALDLPPYWKQVVALFSLHAQRRFGTVVDPDLLGFLDPLYASTIENLWQDRYVASV